MNSWSVLFIALAAVVLQAWVSRRGTPGWYMGCIIPLLYGAAVAWMFVGQDFLRALRVILLGSALLITLLISLGERTSPPRIPPLLHRTPAHNDKGPRRTSQPQDPTDPAAGSVIAPDPPTTFCSAFPVSASRLSSKLFPHI